MEFSNNLNNQFIKIIEDCKIDFIDFGCSSGGSLAFSKKRFIAENGLGIDIDLKKIEKTKAAGFHALCYDINDIPDKKLVRFVVMSHFLEHILSQSDVKAYIRKACKISNQFVYIQQPYFDADSYLFKKGLKLFWSDWSGHPNRMTSLNLWQHLRDLQSEGLNFTFSIHTYKKIFDSKNHCIHPLSSKIDSHFYDIDTHPKKEPCIAFEENVFHELIALIALPMCDHKKILSQMRYDCTLFSNH
jgi:hypothetical protein